MPVSAPAERSPPRPAGEWTRARTPASASGAPATPPQTRPPLSRWLRLAIFPVLLGLNFLLISVVTPGQAPRVEVSYTFFKQQVEAGNVVEISTRADTIQGTFKQAVAYPAAGGAVAKSAGDFSTVVPSFAAGAVAAPPRRAAARRR